MTRNKNGSINSLKKRSRTYEFLFEEAKRRRTKHEKLAQQLHDAECTFKPNITASQQHRSTASALSGRSAKSVPPEKIKNFSGVVDTFTGQPLFKPKIGRPPKKKRNSENLPIGNYLYSQSIKKEEKLNLNKTEIKKELNNSFTQGKTKKILENRKNKIFKNIFKELDEDNVGIISAKNIENTSNLIKNIFVALPREIAEIYSALIPKMEKYKQILTLDGFLNASNKLYDRLQFAEKNILLNYKKTEKIDDKSECYFKVKIFLVIYLLAFNKSKIKRLSPKKFYERYRDI